MDTKMLGNKGIWGALFVVALTMWMMPSDAKAFDLKEKKHKHHHHHHHNHHNHGGVGIGFSTGGSTYVPGHYETTTQTVMVEPERYEEQYVPPVYKTILLKDGTQVTVKVSDGYYTKVLVPARYETRVVQVWVPGYYVQSKPTVNIGLGFRF